MSFDAKVVNKMSIPNGSLLVVDLYDNEGELIMDKQPSVKMKVGEDYYYEYELPDVGDEIIVSKENNEWFIQ